MKYARILAITVFAAAVLLTSTTCRNILPMGIADRLTNLAEKDDLIVQLAELEIDSNQLDAYTELLVEGQRASIELEPGVLTMYSLVNQKDPTKIKIIEVYENQALYKAHIASSHFQKNKQGTLSMAKSLTLIRMDPLVFAAKPL